MKKLILALALSGLSTMAFAADLPSRRAPPVYAPAPPPPVFTWTGFYLGVNAGYAFNSDHNYSSYPNDGLAATGFAGGYVPSYYSSRSDGFTGGGQVGFNYQLGNGFGGGSFGPGGVVVGVEADAAYTDLDRTDTAFGTGGVATTYRSQTEFVGTVRGRLGYAFQNVLIYGTGGYAYGGVNNTITVNGGGLGYFGGRDSIRSGYAYGGGIEYAIPTNSFLNFFHSGGVTLKAEYIHYDLGSSNILVGGAGGAAGSSATTSIHTQGNLVRAGLNYKFDLWGTPAPAPVLAKY